MTRTPLLIAFAAAAALAGCNKQDHTIVVGPPEDNSVNVADNAPVALPPAIAASKVYRCGDNELVYVNWLADNKSATVRTEQAGTPTPVSAAEAGQPMTAPGGYSVSGSASASTVKVTLPGHGSLSCKA